MPKTLHSAGHVLNMKSSVVVVVVVVIVVVVSKFIYSSRRSSSKRTLEGDLPSLPLPAARAFPLLSSSPLLAARLSRQHQNVCQQWTISMMRSKSLLFKFRASPSNNRHQSYQCSYLLVLSFKALIPLHSISLTTHPDGCSDAHLGTCSHPTEPCLAPSWVKTRNIPYGTSDAVVSAVLPCRLGGLPGLQGYIWYVVLNRVRFQVAIWNNCMKMEWSVRACSAHVWSVLSADIDDPQSCGMRLLHYPYNNVGQTTLVASNKPYY